MTASNNKLLEYKKYAWLWQARGPDVAVLACWNVHGDEVEWMNDERMKKERKKERKKKKETYNTIQYNTIECNAMQWNNKDNISTYGQSKLL